MVKSWRGQRVLIMGLGLNQGGLSVAQWLLRQGAVLTITDLKPAAALRPSLDKLTKLPAAKKIHYTLGRHLKSDFIGQDFIIKNPGVPNDSPYLQIARRAGAQIINEAVLFFNTGRGPIVGVTGTRGKSTTSTLLHKILRTEIKANVLAGNIATQGMMAVVDKIKPNSYPVLELSSWHLEGLSRQKISPHVGVITNVLVDHLNRYKSFADYRAAKLALVRHQRAKDFAVLNFDNPHTRAFASQVKSQVYWFSLRKKIRGSFVRQGNIYFSSGRRTECLLPVKSVKLLGEHNLANVLAAVTAAKILGISNVHIRQAVSRFRGIKYRLEYLGTKRGVAVYNDATSTTPDATIAALSALSGRPIILVAGGMDKKLDYRKLARQIKKQVAYLVLLAGTGSDSLARKLRRVGWPSVKMKKNVSSLKSACKLTWQRARPGSVILFSPAATSFNMFINEFDRARQWEKLYYGAQK